MSLLTHEEVEALSNSSTCTLTVIRNTEAAVIKKLAAGVVVEPARYEYHARDGSWHPFVNDKHLADTKENGTWPIRPLYTAEAIAAARVKAIRDCAAACSDDAHYEQLIFALIGAINER